MARRGAIIAPLVIAGLSLSARAFSPTASALGLRGSPRFRRVAASSAAFLLGPKHRFARASPAPSAT